MERDDLRKELEASATRLNLAQSRQQGAEAFANEQQRNAAREREEASKISRENVSFGLLSDENSSHPLYTGRTSTSTQRAESALG